jgi:hypothetical protein
MNGQGAMTPMRRRAAQRKAAKIRRWQVSLIRKRGQALGTVEAAEQRTAETVAVKRFDLSPEQRKRLAVREVEPS